MSTGHESNVTHATDPTVVPPSMSGPPPATPNMGRPVIDPDLVQETKNQIRSIVQEITQLSQSDIAVPEFYDEFLPRVVSALASIGAAIWTIGESGKLELQYQINIPKTGLADSQDHQVQHSLLLKKLLDNGEPALIPPHSGAGDGDDASNPNRAIVGGGAAEE